MEVIDIREYVREHGVENVKFFVPMHPLEGFAFIRFTSSNSPEYLTECHINEDRYKVEEGYKITLQADDLKFGSETYYQMDLESHIRSGFVHIKEPGEYVEMFWYPIPLTDNVDLHAFATAIVKGK